MSSLVVAWQVTMRVWDRLCFSPRGCGSDVLLAVSLGVLRELRCELLRTSSLETFMQLLSEGVHRRDIVTRRDE